MRWIGMADDGETVTLRRFDGRFQAAPAPDDASRLRLGAVVDVETTGLDPVTDEVIEIGLRTFTFDRGTGQVVATHDPLDQLQDPGRPLSETITRLTGLTDDDLRGQRIDWEQVRTLLEGASVIIAHNASFDRAFIDRALDPPLKKVWACSQGLIDWDGHGMPSQKLEILNLFHGFFVRSHRALADVDALLHLLTFTAPGGEAPYLSELLAAARRPTLRVRAVHSPYEAKELLKERGYRWLGDKRVWALECGPEQAEAEKTWLAEVIYPDGGAPELDTIGPFERYKEER